QRSQKMFLTLGLKQTKPKPDNTTNLEY
ncbi:uncharacterized protein METZ01_LOCUS166111, partial [marine metagenome]